MKVVSEKYVKTFDPRKLVVTIQVSHSIEVSWSSDIRCQDWLTKQLVPSLTLGYPSLLMKHSNTSVCSIALASILAFQHMLYHIHPQGTPQHHGLPLRNATLSTRPQIPFLPTARRVSGRNRHRMSPPVFPPRRD